MSVSMIHGVRTIRPHAHCHTTAPVTFSLILDHTYRLPLHTHAHLPRTRTHTHRTLGSDGFCVMEPAPYPLPGRYGCAVTDIYVGLSIPAHSLPLRSPHCNIATLTTTFHVSFLRDSLLMQFIGV